MPEQEVVEIQFFNGPNKGETRSYKFPPPPFVQVPFFCGNPDFRFPDNRPMIEHFGYHEYRLGRWRNAKGVITTFYKYVQTVD